MKQKIKKIQKTKTIQKKLPIKPKQRHYSFGFLMGNNYN